MAEQDTDPKSARVPPYISFQTLRTFLSELNAVGVPPQIDNSVVKKFSGSVKTQLLSALKYLGLMTSDRKPTPALDKLVASVTDESAFKQEMKKLLENAYSFLDNIDLKTATPTMFAEEFRKHSSGQEAVLAKSRTFYLIAARYAGIEIGPRLQAGAPVARGNGQRASSPRRAAPRRAKVDRTDEEDPLPPSDNGDAPNAIMEMLLKKFPDFDPKWDDSLKAKWFEGFEQFMKTTKKNGD